MQEVPMIKEAGKQHPKDFSLERYVSIIWLSQIANKTKCLKCSEPTAELLELR